MSFTFNGGKIINGVNNVCNIIGGKWLTQNLLSRARSNGLRPNFFKKRKKTKKVGIKRNLLIISCWK